MKTGRSLRTRFPTQLEIHIATLNVTCLVLAFTNVYKRQTHHIIQMQLMSDLNFTKKKTLQASMDERCIHFDFFQTLDANKQRLLSRILMLNAVQ